MKGFSKADSKRSVPVVKSMLAVILAFQILAVGLIPSFPSALAAPSDAEAAGEAGGSYLPGIIESSRQEDSYMLYVRRYADVPLASGRAEASARPGSPAVLDAGEAADYTVQVPQDGLYALTVTYRAFYEESVRDFSFSLQIDGALPYAEAGELTLPKQWSDVWVEAGPDENERRPTAEQQDVWQTQTVRNSSGYTQDFLFYLTAGEHALRLESATDGLEITALAFTGETAPADYAAYRAQHAGTEEHGFRIKLEAERPAFKNSSAIQYTVDRSGAAMSPSDPDQLRFNTVTGSNFSTPGEKLTYVFTVPEGQAGYYRLKVKYKQESQQGIAVYRRFELDGEVPYDGMQAVAFPYADQWSYAGPDGAVYLSEGEHTLAVEVVTGPSGQLAMDLEDAVLAMNYLYRRIVMITGTQPDKYRDYELKSMIPELIPALEELADHLEGIAQTMQTTFGSEGGQIQVIYEASHQLRSFIQDPDFIHEHLTAFDSNIAAVASLIDMLVQQPMDIDYLVLSGSEAEDYPLNAGFFTELAYHVRAFFASFFNDYSSLGEGAAVEQTISAWFSGGREQAEIIKELIDQEFTPRYNIGVKLQLVQMPLPQAILAGRAPDVVLNVSRAQPVNLGVRGALLDLSALGEPYEEMKEQYGETGLMPYTFRGACYGVPVTMDFFMMFYRTDILDELGLTPPETWEEFLEALTVIQRANMNVALPYVVQTNQSVAEGGIGTKDLFATLVTQRGGSLYSEELDAAELGQDVVVDAFRQWTEWYTRYGVQLDVNFFSRFRTGAIPLGIQSYGTANMIEAAAPELKGLWEMAPIPGFVQEDGSIDNSSTVSGSAAVIPETTDNPQAAAQLLRWWVSADTQAAYGNAVESLMGPASRYTPADLSVLPLLGWKQSELVQLNKQAEHLVEVPEIPGNYYMIRNIDNAFRDVVISGKKYRESLMAQNDIINAEIQRKFKELKLTDGGEA